MKNGNHVVRTAVLILSILVVFSGCDFLTGIINGEPVADAGEDQIVTLGDVVRLDGNESFDPDGDVISATWEVDSRPSDSGITELDFSNQRGFFTEITPDAVGVYVFRLLVSDGDSDAEDRVRVEVIADDGSGGSGGSTSDATLSNLLIDGVSPAAFTAGQSAPDGGFFVSISDTDNDGSEFVTIAASATQADSDVSFIDETGNPLADADLAETGFQFLIDGTSTVAIVRVITADGAGTEDYQVSFTLDSSVLPRLSSILVEGVEITGFNSNIFSYNAEANFGFGTALTIVALPVDSSLSVQTEAGITPTTFADGSIQFEFTPTQADNDVTISVDDGSGFPASYSISFSDTSEPVNLSDALWARWDFTGNTEDSSGNFNNLNIIQGNPEGSASDRDNNSNSALQFTGTNDRLEQPGNAAINSTPDGVSISLWVQGLPTPGRLISRRNGPGNSSWEVDVVAAGIRTSFAGSVIGITFSASDLDTDSDNVFDDWNHLAWVFDQLSNTYTFYLNGAEYYQNTWSAANDISTTNPIRIGNSALSGSPNAVLDDIRLYSRPVNASEIQALSDLAPVANIGGGPGQAGSPSPANSAIDVALATGLNWSSSADTSTVDIYFGTSNPPTFLLFENRNAGAGPVNAADMTAALAAQGQVLEADTQYFWRVDSTSSFGITTVGQVWNFTTELPVNLSDGLWAQWAFGGNYLDSASPFNNLVANAPYPLPATSATNRFNQANNALQISSVDEGLVTVPGQFNIINSSQSLSIIFWMEGVPGNGRIISRRNAEGGGGTQLWEVDVFNGSLRFSFGGGVSAIWNASGLSGWNNIALVVDGANSRLRIYVNGVLEIDQAFSGAIDAANNPITIGRTESNLGAAPGIYDDFRIYHRAINSAEVNALQ